MRYCSGSTRLADPYRAGVDLGQKLEPASPEVVLAFCTIHYVDGMADVAAGIRDVLGEKVLVCGGSGDGIYETAGVSSHGVSGLGICGEGESSWAATLVRGAHADSAAAAEKAVHEVKAALGGALSWVFVLADGLKADGSAVVDGLRRSVEGPCFGGLTADDRRFHHSITFVGEEVAEDSLMILAATGRVPARWNAASGWKPIGDVGIVTRAEGQVVSTINGRSAEEFMREQTGKPIGGRELAVVPVAEYTSEQDGEFVLRSASRVAADGSVSFFGRVREGARVRVCHASLDAIVGGVETALSGCREGGFEPAAAIVISCAGRKWLLAEAGQEEIERTMKELGPVPLIGIPSYGEIAPFQSRGGTYSPTLFHNVTFVVCVLGR